MLGRLRESEYLTKTKTTDRRWDPVVYSSNCDISRRLLRTRSLVSQWMDQHTCPILRETYGLYQSTFSSSRRSARKPQAVFY